MNRSLPVLSLLLLLFVISPMIPHVFAPSNPTFVTFGDNAECGSHCVLQANGGQTCGFGATTCPLATGGNCNPCDQWGTWGLSSALVVTSGDLLVFMSINFCIDSGSGATATRCDITAVRDALGNTFTMTTGGNNQLASGANQAFTNCRLTNPCVSESMGYVVATHAGTEPATNAFAVTLNCGLCKGNGVVGATSDQWDTEYVIYEYSNAVSISQTFWNSCGTVACTTLTLALTTLTAGDAIAGFAWAESAGRPLNYGSSQTNQHQWAGSNGYPAGDLENLSVGAHTFNFGCGGTCPDFGISGISGEVSSAAPPPPNTPSSFSNAVGQASILVGVAMVMIIVFVLKRIQRGETVNNDKLMYAAVGLGIMFVILQAAAALTH